MLQEPINEKVLNCDMNNLVLSIFLALRHYNYEAFAVGVGIAVIFFIIISLIKGSDLLQGKTNTIQKVCILLGIVFFFATAGFGATQTEIAALTTGLMVASFVGYFLFKDK